MQETWVQFLGMKDPLETEMATHSSVQQSDLVLHTHAHTHTCRAPLVAQTVKNLPVMQETWVQFLGQEETLEKGMVIHSSILAWRIPWTGEPGRLQSIGLQRVRHY